MYLAVTTLLPVLPLTLTMISLEDLLKRSRSWLAFRVAEEVELRQTDHDGYAVPYL